MNRGLHRSRVFARRGRTPTFQARHGVGRRAAHTGGLRRTWSNRLSWGLAACGVASVPVSCLLAWTLIGPSPYPNSRRLQADSHRDSFVLFRGRPIDLDREGESLRANTAADEAPPPSQRRVVVDGEEQDVPKNSWAAVTESLAGLKTNFASLPDKLSNLILPDWARGLPGFINKLQNELSMAPGSLAEEVWQEANDPEVNPEIVWEATVRVSNDLCDDEKIFLRNRKHHTRVALARYLDVPVRDIHPDDVPVIAMCGSGGGLRALVANTSSYQCTKQAGLFDCMTYTAGVSGSCWLQALYFSSITGQSFTQLIHHLKNRLGVHIAYPPAAFGLITSAPTNKYLLGGMIEKLKGVPEADFGIVDVYGLLLAARLFVPKGELNVTEYDLKISNQRRFLSHGEHPLPIYTAVRHEIPEEEEPVIAGKTAIKQKGAWFQWFEFTPYEFWCEELVAGIPTWALGRRFEGGKTRWRQNGLSLPETRLPLLLGIWGSAFCATLSHYYHEIRPLVRDLAGFKGVDSMMAERDEDLVKRHVIDPASLPNFAMGMEGTLPDTVPQSLFREERLKLMDAGMSNNLPIYPLLRPGRGVDVIISFDVSADARQDNWLHVVEGYARQRGIQGWPVGAGWPPADTPDEQIAADLEGAQAGSPKEARQRVAEAADGKTQAPDLTYCNVWVGSTTERIGEPPAASSSSRPLDESDDDVRLTSDDAGITVVYFPLLHQPASEKRNTKSTSAGSDSGNADADTDPRTAPYMSTWNFVYTPDQVDRVAALAARNFERGEERTKRAVRAVWQRKRRLRLEREAEERAQLLDAKKVKRRAELRSGRGVGKKPGEGDHGDHFS